MRSSLTFNLTALGAAVLCSAVLAGPAAAQPQEDRDYDQRGYQREERQPEQQTRSSDRNQDQQRDEDQRRWQEDRTRQDGQQRDMRAQDRQGGPQRMDDRGQTSDGRPAGLGVSVVDADRGVRVREVWPDSPAAQAGIRRGDEILAVENRRVSSSEELAAAVRRLRPGTRVELRVSSDGQDRTIAARLETRREALDRMAQQERFFRGGPPPWGGDQVLEHVNALERQLRQMRREIDDLRAMLNSDPTRTGGPPARSDRGDQRRFDRQFDSQRSRPADDREFRSRNQ